MMSDPFPDQSLSADLAASTAVIKGNDEAMQHAGEQAAHLLGAVAAGKPVKGIRRPSSLPKAGIVTVSLAPTSDVTPTHVEAAPAVSQDPAGSMLHLDAMKPQVDIGVDAEASSGGSASEPGKEVLARTSAVAEILPAVPAVLYASDEPSPEPDTSAAVQFRSKYAEAMRANVESSFTFWMSLMRVKTPAEAFELNVRHARDQMESFASQSRELSWLAQKAAGTLVSSMRGPV